MSHFTLLFLPKARGWDIREHLGPMEPTDIGIHRRRGGWSCAWDPVGTVAVGAYASWRQAAPQRAALLTTGVTPWGSTAGLPDEPTDLKGLAEVSQEIVRTFPVMPLKRPFGVMTLEWHIESPLDPPLAAALLSAQYALFTGTLARCTRSYCGALFVKPTPTRNLCDTCTKLFQGRVTREQRGAWERVKARLRGRKRYDPKYASQQYDQDIRQALQELMTQPFGTWRRRWDTRRGPQGRRSKTARK